MTFEQVKELLSRIEAREEMYHQLGPEDLPHLQRLMKDEEAWLAARAVFAAARLPSGEARELLVEAAADPRPQMRIAVATGLQQAAASGGGAESAGFADSSDELLESLLQDPDPGVVKYAVRAVSGSASPAVREKLSEIARAGPETVRAEAQEKAQSLDE